MKKLLFLLALVGFAAGAQAQTETEYPMLKGAVVTNPFWSNWFAGVGVDLESSYSDQERHQGISKNPFQGKRLGFGGEVYVGKWFVPQFGVRLRGHVGQNARVAYWGDPKGSEKFWGLNFQIQPMFNLNNILCGYNPNRVWTISPYLGVGAAHHMAHTRGTADSDEGSGDWSFLYSCGLFNQFNISKKMYVSLDAYVEMFDAKNDGIRIEGYDTNLSNTHDAAFGVSVGLGWNLGTSGWNQAPDVAAILAMHQAALAALNDQISNQEQENERLKRELANRKPITKERVVKEVVPGAPASVFFNLNSARIASKKDLVNVQAIADAAKQGGNKILVTGYADSKTGSPAYNQTLSEKRANAVADALVGMGVDRNSLIVEGKGGVNDLAPYSYNRRVVVKIQ